MQYRQGDVFLISVKSIPANAIQEAEKDRVILAYGEVTGHSHAFYTDRVRFFRETCSDGVRAFIDVVGDASVSLKHEEHTTIEVPPGKYEVRIQSEYSPAEIRRVCD